MADRYLCRDCSKVVTATSRNRYRTHTDGDGDPCEEGSGRKIPEDLIMAGPESGPPEVPKENVDFAVCPQCERKVKLTRLGYFENHDTTLKGGDRCEVSGVRHKHARRTETVANPLVTGDPSASPIPQVKDSERPVANRGLAIEMPEPGEWHEEGEYGQPIGALALPASSSVSTGSSAPESATVSTLSQEWTEALDSFFQESVHLILMDALGEPETPAPATSVTPGQSPDPGFDDLLFEARPAQAKATAQPMGDLAKELATRIKETFYAYSNRKTSDNRSAQTTLGPSEIGTPCDRRLAMALMNIPAVNPGGDGWAAFVGTCTHAGMAEVYTFADAGTGRYAVEMPVFLGVPTVPRGTTDLLDRRDGVVVDWKVMGWSSLKKFKEKGPSDTYRTQAHVYALGAERGGEKVRNVAIVGLPRGGFSLDEMHIWTEKYDKKLAQAALDRVEKIANDIAATENWAGLDIDEHRMNRARRFPTGDDCSYCPFHLKGDKEMRRGCPGK